MLRKFTNGSIKINHIQYAVEAAHIYMDEKPNESHKISAQIGAEFVARIEEYGYMVIKQLFIDNYNPNPKDFIIDGKIILEFKTVDYLTKNDYNQLKRYLITLNLKLGIIINFRQRRLAPKRVLNSEYNN